MAALPSAATAVAQGDTGSSDGRAAQSARKLTGRFLHITGGFVGSLLGRETGTDDML
jgi:hypothetical protein